jgi:hypothetical protein
VLAGLTGVAVNRAQVLYADGNPSNDNSTAPVTVLGLCGNPYGNGTKPVCGGSLVYVGPDNATIPANSDFSRLCCVSDASQLAGC